MKIDEYCGYPKAFIQARIHGSKHKTVNHTNGIESAFSLFKRGIVGSYLKVSIKHPHRFLSKFETRFKALKKEDRFEPTPYAELTAE